MKAYLKWLFTEHKNGKIKVILFILGVIQCFVFTDDILVEYFNYDMPLSILVLAFIAMYGFTIGIAYQPYTIYKRLKK